MVSGSKTFGRGDGHGGERTVDEHMLLLAQPAQHAERSPRAASMGRGRRLLLAHAHRRPLVRASLPQPQLPLLLLYVCSACARRCACGCCCRPLAIAASQTKQSKCCKVPNMSALLMHDRVYPMPGGRALSWNCRGAGVCVLDRVSERVTDLYREDSAATGGYDGWRACVHTAGSSCPHCQTPPECQIQTVETPTPLTPTPPHTQNHLP